jgi:2',3'-cyclic-nucleotide 2'-phosphodiesterase/3'-nucleotidase/5'-nucleotidase
MRKFYKLLLLMLLINMFIITCGTQTTQADGTDTATLRILATGDLHGQVTAYDYETDLKLPYNGLSKLASLVEENRKEAGDNNTLLMDAGDFLYDYTSNFFYNNYPDMVQPILKAMSVMDYDCITMGNHEFDYPWDYLHDQLDRSGMLERTVVCNTVWHDSGSSVFAPSAVINMKLSLSGGGQISVRVGIIGSTTNAISARREDYYNKIDALNSYDSIIKEADRLKTEDKADIIIVLLHGGIGSAADIASVDKSSAGKASGDNIGYALTRVDTIDAVVTGHTHNAFPDTSSFYNSYENADAIKGCINGKPVLATASYAKALGIIDLKLMVDSDGKVKITGGSSALEYVSESTPENKNVTSAVKSSLRKIESAKSTDTYKIAEGIVYHNYDVVVQDNNLYQLLNNAKIDYGMSYLAEYQPKKKNTPVIACTRSLLDSLEPYISIKDSFTEGKIAMLLSESSPARPSGYIQMYEITGKVLREWLEYNASIYAAEGTTLKNMLQKYVTANKDVSTLLDEAFIYDHSSYYIFDGISYTIDLSKKARYNSSGKLTGKNNSRISSLKYNGANVTDNQKFILVTDAGIPQLSFLPTEEDMIKDIRDYETGKNITMNYIKKLSSLGDISVTADNNWSLKAGKDYTFILGIPKNGLDAAANSPWNMGTATETLTYSFLKGKLPAANQGMNIIATQARYEANNTPVPVKLSITSKNAVKEIRYLKGRIATTGDKKWNNAANAVNSSFSITGNGLYTIRVRDNKNNYALAYVNIDLYDPDILPSPKLNTVTNRFDTFTGTAVPDSTLHLTIGDDKYSATVGKDGSFKVTITPPGAFSQVQAYVEAGGKKSAVVHSSVRKTGPSAAHVDTVKVGDTSVSGKADPYTYVYALIWKTIYVGKGQTGIYKNSDFYNSSYNIVETDITLNPDTGEYTIVLPQIKHNMNVFIYSIDRFGATSKSTKQVPVQ